MSFPFALMVPGTAPTVDPNFASVTALLHFEGADASTTFTDVKGHTFTPTGNAQIDTAQFKFGSSSGLFDGTGDYLTSANHADFQFGSGDFTIECWTRLNSVSGSGRIIAKTDNSLADFDAFALLRNGTNMQFYASSNGTTSYDIINGVLFGSGLATGVWYHVAVTRSGSTFRGFLDGAMTTLGTSASAITNSFNLRIGGDPGAASDLNGWIDEVRITKGVARYTAAFTRPTARFPDA